MSEIVMAVLENLIDWLFEPLDGALSDMLVAAFTGNAGSVGVDEWNVAITAANRVGWIMGFVSMIVCVIGSLHAATKGDVWEGVKSFAMSFLAWPLTAVSVSVMITVEGIVSLVTARILSVGLGGSEGSANIVHDVVSAVTGPLANVTLVIRIIVYVVVLIAALCLCCMLAARTIGLVLLASIAPLPIMMAGWSASRPTMLKWLQAVLGTMLIKPATALVLVVGAALCSASGASGSDFWDAVVGVATVWMACFTPKAVWPAVSFVGENVAAGMQDRMVEGGKGLLRTSVQLTGSVLSGALSGGLGGLAGAVGGLAGGQAGEAGHALGSLLRGGRDAEGPAGSGSADAGGAARASDAGRGGSDGSRGAGSDAGARGAADPVVAMPGSPVPASGRDADHGSSDRGASSRADATSTAASSPERGSSSGPAAAAPGAPGGRGGDGGDAAPGAPGGPGGRGGDGGAGADGPASSPPVSGSLLA